MPGLSTLVRQPSRAGFLTPLTPSRRFINLIANGALRSSLSFSRGSAAAFARSGDNALVLASSGVPRFDTDLGLLIEEQRQNLFLNSLNGVAANHFPPNLNVSSTDVPTIHPSVLMRKHTRDTSTGDTNVAAGPAPYAVTTGVNMAYSIWVYLPSSQNYGGSPLINVTPDTNQTLVSQVTPDFSKRDQWQRINRVYTPTITGTLPLVLRASIANGSFFYSCAPQVEVGNFPTSNILTSGTSQTRIADVASVPLSSLGIPATGACTIVGTFTLLQTTASVFNQFMFQLLLDGPNRLFVTGVAGTDTVSLIRRNTDNVAGIASPITVSLGSPIRVAFTNDGAGRAAISINGSAVQAVTGAPTSYTSLEIGSYGGSNCLNGYAKRMFYTPKVTADADLPALSMRGTSDFTGMREIIQWP